MTPRARQAVVLVVVFAAGLGIGVGLLRWQRATALATLLPAELKEVQPAPLVARLNDARARVLEAPRDSERLRELAKLYLANGYDKQAEVTLQLLMQREPAIALWPHLLARLMSGYGRLEEALPLQALVVRLAPNYIPARLRWAEALAKSNAAEQAATAFKSVLELERGNVYALNGLAKLAVQREDWAGAERVLDEAIAADRSFSASFALLSTVYEKQGYTQKALLTGRKASDLGRFRDFDDPWAEELGAYCFDSYRLRVQAATLAATGRREKATEVWLRAASLDPRNAKLCREIGTNYLELKDREHAVEWLQRSIEFGPGEPESYIELIGILKAKGDRKAGMELLERGLAACPRSAGIHFEYASLLRALGRDAEAEPHLREAIRLEPENLSGYFELATYEFHVGRMEEGRQLLELANAREPDNVTALSMLARFHILNGDAEAGRKYLKKSRECGLDPKEYRSLAVLYRGHFFEEP